MQGVKEDKKAENSQINTTYTIQFYSGSDASYDSRPRNKCAACSTADMSPHGL